MNGVLDAVRREIGRCPAPAARVNSAGTVILAFKDGFSMALKRRSLFVFPVIVLACSILGGFYGPQGAVGRGRGRQRKNWTVTSRSFSKVLGPGGENFADKVSAG